MAKEKWTDWDIYVRGGCQCVYCGLDGKRDFASWQQLDVDHLIPKCRGGLDSKANKVVACLRCNMMKGSYDPRGYDAGAPTYSEPPSSEEHERLIEVAREYIRRGQADLESDYGLMLNEIGGMKP